MEFTDELRIVGEKWIQECSKNISDQFPEQVSSLNEKAFLAVETEIHPKLLADWNRKDLLLYPTQRKKHHRFTLAEFVWIKMIEKMREYNFSLDLIRTFRNEMILSVGLDLEGLLENKNFIELMLKTIPEEHRAKAMAKFAEPELQSEMLGALSSLSEMNHLDNLVLICLFSRQPLSFLIDKEGKGIVFSPMMFDIKGSPKLFMDIMGHTHMNLSLSEIVAQVLCLAPIEKVSTQLQLVTNEEAAVLEVLREKGLKSVVIRFDNNSELNLIEITKQQHIDKRSRLMELILLNGYQDITVKTAKGNIVVCENTRKVKLK